MSESEIETPGSEAVAAHQLAAPLPERPIFFLHIPKTGGNTVVSHMLAFMPVEQVFPPPPQLTLRRPDLIEAGRRIEGLRFVHGHVDGAIGHHLPLDKLALTTVVRNPVRLVVSRYLYAKYQTAQQMHQAAKALPIDRFLRHYPAYVTEPQSRVLARAFGLRTGRGLPLPPESGAAVLQALDRFAFVGVTERMAESLTVMSQLFGLPSFPAQRENPSPASAAEAAECDAVVRRDEFLQLLGLDFVLRRMAEARLDAAQRRLKLRTLVSALRAGAEGTAPRPWAPARGEGCELVFLEGWLPQGWAGDPRPGAQYWWTGRRAELLAFVPSGRPCRVSVQVVNTVGFDAAQIEALVDGTPVPVSARLCEPGVELSFTIGAAALAAGDGAAVIELFGPKVASFNTLDPSLNDHVPRSFAVREMTIALVGE